MVGVVWSCVGGVFGRKTDDRDTDDHHTQLQLLNLSDLPGNIPFWVAPDVSVSQNGVLSNEEFFFLERKERQWVDPPN